MKNFSPFLLGVAMLALTACASSSDDPSAAAPKAEPPPMTMTATMPSSSVISPGVEERLARLEDDVMVMKGQLQLVRPILEKMPALQDKLSELVGELKRIDARVAAAQASAQELPVSASAAPTTYQAPLPPKVEPVKPAAPVAVAVPKATPIIDPAPARPLVTPPKTGTVEPVVTAPPPVKTPASPSLASVPAIKPAPMTTTAGQQATVPVAAAPSSSVVATSVVTPSVVTLNGVRLGDDVGQSRLVMDVSAPTPFKYDLDNVEKVLVIELDAPGLAAAPAAAFDKSPLVASYAAQTVDGKKTQVTLQLRAPVQVLKTSTLPPGADKGDRIVIDLGPMTP